MHILSASKIENIFTPSEIIQVLENGIIDCESGVYDVPDRIHLEQKGNVRLIMPAIGEKYFCTKIVSVIPSNPKLNLPVITGKIILNKVATGETLAILDAPMITALRTAAVGALGLEIISQKIVEKIGIIGLGVQGIWQAIFAFSVRPIKQVFCFSRTKSRFVFYKKIVLEKCPELEIIWCETADEVVQNSEVIYTCTNSSKPVFSNDEKLIQNKRFISIGSFTKEMQELPNVVYENADVLMIDSEAARHEVGDVIDAVKNSYFKKEDVVSIGKFSTKKRAVSDDKNVVFKSVGMAGFDLALASAVHEKITN